MTAEHVKRIEALLRLREALRHLRALWREDEPQEGDKDGADPATGTVPSRRVG